jgi:hypothetical protein
MTDDERYLADVAAQVRGAGSGRLLAELRGHVDDAVADHVASGRDPAEAVQFALERLGPADELAAAWRAQASMRRVRARRRAALVAFAAVSASALALVQHASGRAPTQGNRTVTTAPATEALPPCASATATDRRQGPLGALSAFPGWAERPIATAPRAADDLGGSRRSGANPIRCTRR